MAGAASFPPAAAVLGFLAVAIETAIVDAWLLAPPLRPGVRALHVLFAILQLVACGAIIALVVAGWQALRSRRKIPAFPFVLMGALVVGAVTLPEDLGGAADKISAARGHLVLPALIAAVALLQAGVVALLGRLARSPRRWLQRAPAAGLGVLLALANPMVLPHDYPGVHLAIALVAGVAAAFGVAGPASRLAARLPASRGARVAFVAAGAALAGVISAPLPNAVIADMLRATGAVVAPFASRLRVTATRRANVPVEMRPWFERREGQPAPPARPRVLPPDGVVVLLTVDALRADVILSGKYDARLPNFKALRDEGVAFTQARSPGSQTVPVVTGIFTGKYYTQLYWSGGTAKHAWSAEDTSVRFPELLSEHGVVTVTMPTLREVTTVNGTVRGFAEDRVAWKRWPNEPSPLAAAIAERVGRRLDRAERRDDPLFLYVHFVDAHAPYNRGGIDCQPFECYLREVELVDAAIGEIRSTLQGSGFASRSVLIVTADHGEAFGEHGQRWHANTLYDELLRVPLLIAGPGFPAHRVDTRVTLLDLGPTILELFGLAAPPAFMGQSLVRLLKNEPDRLTRPIAADSGRLMQAMVFDDNVKIIRNNRNHTVEMYDLNKDPGEERSIFETAPDAEDRLAIVDALFAANAFRKPGYSPPYRK